MKILFKVTCHNVVKGWIEVTPERMIKLLRDIFGNISDVDDEDVEGYIKSKFKIENVSEDDFRVLAGLCNSIDELETITTFVLGSAADKYEYKELAVLSWELLEAKELETGERAKI